MQVILWFYGWVILHSLSLWIGLCAGVGLLIMLGKKEQAAGKTDVQTHARLGLRPCIGLWIICLLAVWMIHAVLGYKIGIEWQASLLMIMGQRYSSMMILAILLGICCHIGRKRYLRPLLSRFIKYIRVEQKTETASDIRYDYQRLKPKQFLPVDYYHPDSMFYGLSDTHQPVHDRLSDWCKMNQKIIGPTQVGKGVHLGVQVDQAIRKNMGVWVIDPKPDRHLETIMAKACVDTGRTMITLDFSPEGKGNWAPFAGGTERERRARVLYAFGLNDSGGESDFYKLQERTILDQLCHDWDGSLQQLKERLHHHPRHHEAPRIQGVLREWMQLERLNPKKGKGFSVMRSLEENAVVYMRASLDDRLIQQVASLLIMETMQAIKSSFIQRKRNHHVTLVIDEVRFMVSDLLGDALATIVGFNANVVLAYQSVKDIRAAKQGVSDSESLEASINTNCKLTLCYAAVNHETAQWVAELSGTVQKQVARSETIKVNEWGAETWGDQRTVTMVEEYAIPENLVKALPERTGVLLRPNQPAQIVYTCWVPVEV
ncbi:MAG: type IV secretion system DNA-binding domain-containing protein [Alphaproteobacteria bacterium]|nr:type IV secretion system DNA-binding domain-containing protein [Alphaproteobacteria bacterium]